MLQFRRVAPISIEFLISLHRRLEVISLAHFRKRVGQEYNPYTLLRGIDRISASISIEVTGLKTKDLGSFCFGKAEAEG